MTPINTGKVQIGRCYIKPPMRVQGDAVVIQSALLAKPQAPADRAVNWALFVGAIAVILGCSFWSTSMSCTSQCNHWGACVPAH